MSDHGIRFRNYPFPPSRVYPERFVAGSDIASVCFYGPALVQVGNDFAFVSREREPELRALMARHRIPERPSNYNWDWILSPYLDTEFSEDDIARQALRLSEAGFDAGEVDAIRHEVGDVMWAYNFQTMLWEWAGFGLYDVLSAMRAFYDAADFEDFYWRAMEIEGRTRP